VAVKECSVASEELPAPEECPAPKKSVSFAPSTSRHSTRSNNKEMPDNYLDRHSTEDLNFLLEQYTNRLTNQEADLQDARKSLMRLSKEIVTLDNEIRSMEQEEASEATTWSLPFSFFPRRAFRIEEQRKEKGPSYHAKIDTRQFKEKEKKEKVKHIKTCQMFASSFRQYIVSIELEIQRKEGN
jgi:chromosome segregation ATPase